MFFTTPSFIIQNRRIQSSMLWNFEGHAVETVICKFYSPIMSSILCVNYTLCYAHVWVLKLSSTNMLISIMSVVLSDVAHTTEFISREYICTLQVLSSISLL